MAGFGAWDWTGEPVHQDRGASHRWPEDREVGG